MTELPNSLTNDPAQSSPSAVAVVAAPSPAAPARRAHLTIRPSKPWKFVDLIEVWEFRDLLFSLAGRDLKLRYKQTILGVAWVVLQPLLGALIFTFVFGVLGHMKSSGTPYFVLSFAGLLGWNLFANTISRSSTCMVANSNLVSKVFFPRVILPVASSLSVIVDFCCAFCVLLILLLIYRVNPGVGILLLPIWIAIMLMAALGIGMVTSALAVSYRDIQYILPVFMQMLMYASPVGYSLASVHAKLLKDHKLWVYPWYCANPLTGMLSAIRWSLLGRGHLLVGPTVWSAACAIILFASGLMLFKKMERRFADVI